MSRRRRVAIVGGARFGVEEPHAGGLEVHTSDLARGLRRRGWEVTTYSGRVHGGPGSHALWEPGNPVIHARADLSTEPREVLGEHMAYQRVMLRIMRAAMRGELEHVHLNNCHHLPIAMAPLLPVPVTATLHSPATEWTVEAFAQAHRESGAPVAVAVSANLADQYADAAGWRPQVLENGVDLRGWHAGSGSGGYVAWCGRLVPEKAPHLAIDAARLAGLPIKVAGPAHDRTFFDAEIAPRLGSGAEYAGHLSRAQLDQLLGEAAACLVTPVWAEPFGLVAVESMACGTPVAAFPMGALPAIVDERVGAISAGVTPECLAEALARALRCSRRDVRLRVEERFSLERMLDGYEELFESARGRSAELETVA